MRLRVDTGAVGRCSHDLQARNLARIGHPGSDSRHRTLLRLRDGRIAAVIRFDVLDTALAAALG